MGENRSWPKLPISLDQKPIPADNFKKYRIKHNPKIISGFQDANLQIMFYSILPIFCWDNGIPCTGNIFHWLKRKY